MNILVTGGAGYIGSHTTYQLLDHGHNVVVLDNLSTGHKWAVPKQSTFIHGDVGDIELVQTILKQHAIEAVVHFAASIEVEESVTNPIKYFHNNTANTIRLLLACKNVGVQKFIFSSTAAVYGNPKTAPILETADLKPVNPYGESKLLIEQCLKSCAQPQNHGAGFRYVALRYFNVAGASSKYPTGPSHPNGSHLIKAACQAATGQRDHIRIFGTDYNTPDGTCIRDYIHVDDLAHAHVLALNYVNDTSNLSITLNCGYGRGYSVREVLDVFQRSTGVTLKINHAPRRAGDPENLSADSSLLKKVLGWKPQYDDLKIICTSAYEWEKQLLRI